MRCSTSNGTSPSSLKIAGEIVALDAAEAAFDQQNLADVMRLAQRLGVAPTAIRDFRHKRRIGMCSSPRQQLALEMKSSRE